MQTKITLNPIQNLKKMNVFVKIRNFILHTVYNITLYTVKYRKLTQEVFKRLRPAATAA